MVLVLASIFDRAAASFATELAFRTSASLVTCSDLALAPLSLEHPSFDTSTITINGERLAVPQFRGVLNLLPVVFPDELLFYDEAEREYQSAEFHALLTFFLSSLRCPVVNRPTAASLTGPFASQVGWRQLARAEGLPVSKVKITSGSFVNPFVITAGTESIEIACLNGRVIGSSHGNLSNWTINLAKRGDVKYLRAIYTRGGDGDSRLLTAITVPDVTSGPTRAALIDYFVSRS